MSLSADTPARVYAVAAPCSAIGAKHEPPCHVADALIAPEPRHLTLACDAPVRMTDAAGHTLGWLRCVNGRIEVKKP